MLAHIKETVTHLHAPSKLYLVLFIVALVLNFNMLSWRNVFIALAFAAAWTAVMEYCCKKGFKSGCWILAILPFAYLYFQKSISMNRLMSSASSSSDKK